MKKLAILFVTLLSGVSLSFAEVAVPTLYGDVDPNGDSSCLSLTYNMRLGSRDATTNGEVSMLQDFLGIDPSGYFGKVTLTAAKTFQAKNGLLSSGYVGPQTRAKIKGISCSGEVSSPITSTTPTTVGTSLPAGCTGTSLFSPMTGEKCVAVSAPKTPTASTAFPFNVERDINNPLTVQAEYVLGSPCSNFTLDWGDGTNSNFVSPPTINCIQIMETYTKRHTYTKAGTYTVKFQTGAYPQKSISVTVGNTVTPCPDGMPPTGDGCIIRCPDGTTVVGRKCPVTPTCPTPGTVPVCPGTSTQVPYNNQTCSWDWNVCQIASTQTVARIVENPTLKLGYDSVGKEATLTGRIAVEITAGKYDAYLGVTGWGLSLVDNSGNILHAVNSYSSSGSITSGEASVVNDKYGNQYYKISAGKKAVIAQYTKVSSQHLFAGSYVMSLRGLGVYRDVDGQGYSELLIAPNKSNSVSVIGEVSPYIKNVTADATPQVNVTIHGVRFHSTSNTVTIGNTTRTLPSIANGLYINTTLADFGITSSGQYTVQVVHPTTGASNRYVLNVSNTPTTDGGASASVVGTPTLKLVYAMPKPGFVDPTGGEASLEASFTVEVKAGSKKIVIGKNGIPDDPTGLAFSVSLNSPNSVHVPSYTSKNVMVNIPEMGATVQMADVYTIQPGQTVRFIVSQTWNPKQMFAGSYTSSIRLDGYSGGLLPSNQTQQTNAAIVVGEVSPYISMVTVDDNGTVRVTGERFDLQDNKVVVDGVTLISAVKGDSRLMTFDPAMYNLASGGHTMYVKNSVKGDSNSYYFTVNGSTALKPTILSFVANPPSIESGKTTVIHWSAQGVTSCSLDGSQQGGTAPTATTLAGDRTVYGGSHTLACFGPGGSVSQELLIPMYVVDPVICSDGKLPVNGGCPAPKPTQGITVSLTQSSATTNVSEPFTLNWSSSGATSCYLQKLAPNQPQQTEADWLNSGVVCSMTSKRVAENVTGECKPTPGVVGNHVFRISCFNDVLSTSAKQDINHTVVASPVVSPFAKKVESLFQIFLGRNPSTTEATTYQTKLANNTTLSGSAWELITTSAEGLSRHGDIRSMSNDAYLEFLYRVVLGRTPDTAGKAYHLDRLNQGRIERLPLLEEFINSPESRTHNPLLFTASPTGYFNVLTSSVKQLEQVYTLSTTGAGTIALSAFATLAPVTEEIINFTGLKRGANEVRVSRLKEILRTISPSVSIGCANLSTSNTLYGPTTEECVRIFQELNELEPTGTVNEQTNKALNRVLAR